MKIFLIILVLLNLSTSETQTTVFGPFSEEDVCESNLRTVRKRLESHQGIYYSLTCQEFQPTDGVNI